MIDRVVQRHRCDCGLAALATILNITYEEAEAIWPGDVTQPVGLFEHKGILLEEMLSFLWRQRLHPQLIPTLEGVALQLGATETDDPAGVFNRNLITNQEVTELISGRRGLLVVRALRGPGMHWVAWDGARVIDPDPKEDDYKSVAGYTVLFAVLVGV